LLALADLKLEILNLPVVLHHTWLLSAFAFKEFYWRSFPPSYFTESVWLMEIILTSTRVRCSGFQPQSLGLLLCEMEVTVAATFWGCLEASLANVHQGLSGGRGGMIWAMEWS
jgi:hypothetical protein